MKDDTFYFVFVAPVFVAACVLWQGFIVSVFWGWFVQPLGVPAIGVLHAIGLTMAAHYIFLRHTAKDEEDWRGRVGRWLIEKSFLRAFSGGIALLVGWILSRGIA